MFVRPDEVSDVWAGVTSVFRDYGYRRSRNHARLKFLMADWGPEKFRQVLQDEYLHRALPDGPPPPASPAHRDHTGIRPQNNGLYLGRGDHEVRTDVGNRAAAIWPTSPNSSAVPGWR